MMLPKRAIQLPQSRKDGCGVETRLMLRQILYFSRLHHVSLDAEGQCESHLTKQSEATFQQFTI